MGATLSNCRINNTLVKFTVTSCLHGKCSTYGGQFS